MQIKLFTLGPLETNCFLLASGKKAAMVDVGGEPGEVLNYLEQNGLELADILITHMHFDHVLGVKALAEATGAKVRANGRDEFLLTGQSTLGFPNPPAFEYENLDEGPADFIGQECRVFATPGHSPGSLSYYFPAAKALFCGDVLFYRSVGRSDFPGGDTKTLMNSIRQKIYTLPDETTVYPGHMLETNAGDEKRLNPFVTAHG